MFLRPIILASIMVLSAAIISDPVFGNGDQCESFSRKNFELLERITRDGYKFERFKNTSDKWCWFGPTDSSLVVVKDPNEKVVAWFGQTIKPKTLEFEKAQHERMCRAALGKSHVECGEGYYCICMQIIRHLKYFSVRSKSPKEQSGVMAQKKRESLLHYWIVLRSLG